MELLLPDSPNNDNDAFVTNAQRSRDEQGASISVDTQIMAETFIVTKFKFK